MFRMKDLLFEIAVAKQTELFQTNLKDLCIQVTLQMMGYGLIYQSSRHDKSHVMEFQ